MDLEFAAAATASKKKTGESAPTGAGAGDTKRAEDFARFLAGDGNSGLANLPAVDARELAAGAKKRKAGGAFPQHSQTPPSTSSPAPTGARKPTNAAPSATARETNVMTFGKSNACLNKRGELVADDGTRLCVNGEFLASPEAIVKLHAVPRLRQPAKTFSV